MTARPLSQIARECRTSMMEQASKASRNTTRNWRMQFCHAVPYLDAMLQLNSIEENFYADTGKSCVLYFLANTSGWRGEKARALKAELKALTK